MEVKILEVAGLIPAMLALRLPYSKEPRSCKAGRLNDGLIIDATEDEPLAIVRQNANIYIDKNDLALAGRLVKGGDCEAKAMRGIIAYLQITAPRYFFQEFNTYRVGCECLSSTSTMHTITKGVTADMFDCDMHEAQEYYDMLQPLIEQYNKYDYELKNHSDAHTEEMLANLKDLREMQFRRIKRHIPECFLQKRIFAISYQCLRNMWIWRHNHRLVEWRTFCDVIEHLPFADELILAGIKQAIS